MKQTCTSLDTGSMQLDDGVRDNWAVISDFIRRGLLVGGVAQVSCNIPPGWAAFAAVRHLQEVAAAGVTLAQVIETVMRLAGTGHRPRGPD
jgi:hypothetical protein